MDRMNDEARAVARVLEAAITDAGAKLAELPGGKGAKLVAILQVEHGLWGAANRGMGGTEAALNVALRWCLHVAEALAADGNEGASRLVTALEATGVPTDASTRAH